MQAQRVSLRSIILVGVLCPACEAPDAPRDLPVAFLAPLDAEVVEAVADFEACMLEGEGCEGAEELSQSLNVGCAVHLDARTASIMEADFDERLARAPSPANAGGKTRVVPVYFHVLTDGSAAADVSDQQIAEQMAVLNDAYAGTSFTFSLVATDRTENAAWYTMEPGSAAETEAKAALRQGGPESLNIYTARLGTNLEGWATYPWAYQSEPLEDGVVVCTGCLPGGDVVAFNLGDTAVHEVGHWLGLYHTAWGTCTNKGDLVSDTPPEFLPASGCPVGRDTCASQPGLDPIENYMDTTDDLCRYMFTPGQASRMQKQWNVYR